MRRTHITVTVTDIEASVRFFTEVCANILKHQYWRGSSGSLCLQGTSMLVFRLFMLAKAPALSPPAIGTRATNQCAHAFTRQHFQQQRVRYPSVDNVCGLYAVFHRV